MVSLNVSTGEAQLLGITKASRKAQDGCMASPDSEACAECNARYGYFTRVSDYVDIIASWLEGPRCA